MVIQVNSYALITILY